MLKKKNRKKKICLTLSYGYVTSTLCNVYLFIWMRVKKTTRTTIKMVTFLHVFVFDVDDNEWPMNISTDFSSLLFSFNISIIYTHIIHGG